MKKQTKEEFIYKSKLIFNNLLDYSLVNYINSTTNVILTCKIHGNFIIKPAAHLSYKRSCPICSGSKYNQEEFIKKCNKIHNNKFNYNKTQYYSIKEKVIITCKNHGDFLQTPDKHINGKQGCPKCKKSSKKDLKFFLEKSFIIHNNTYDYSLVNFKKMFDKVLIICKIHGVFEQTPANHINHKQGCQKCAFIKSRLSLNDFIKKAKIIHLDKYDYSKVIYTNAVTKIEIICKKHGVFYQKPNSHLSGSGCSKCSGHISKKETNWLNSLKIPLEYRNKTLKINDVFYKVDAFDYLNNTIYEFYGDYLAW